MMYVILIVSAYYPTHPVAYTNGMAEAMDIAIKAKALYTGKNVNRGDNRIVIKRKLY